MFSHSCHQSKELQFNLAHTDQFSPHFSLSGIHSLSSSLCKKAKYIIKQTAKNHNEIFPCFRIFSFFKSSSQISERNWKCYRKKILPIVFALKILNVYSLKVFGTVSFYHGHSVNLLRYVAICCLWPARAGVGKVQYSLWARFSPWVFLDQPVGQNAKWTCFNNFSLFNLG